MMYSWYTCQILGIFGVLVGASSGSDMGHLGVIEGRSNITRGLNGESEHFCEPVISVDLGNRTRIHKNKYIADRKWNQIRGQSTRKSGIKWTILLETCSCPWKLWNLWKVDWERNSSGSIFHRTKESFSFYSSMPEFNQNDAKENTQVGTWWKKTEK